MIDYAYTVLSYSQDPSTGEALNVGVLLYARSVPHIGLKIERSSSRLAKAFPNFESHQYNRYRKQLLQIVNKYRTQFREDALENWNAPTDVMQIALTLIPDQGLSYRFSPMRRGLTTDVQAETEQLFRQFVPSGAPDSIHKRHDAEIWKPVSDVFEREQVLPELGCQKVETSNIDIEFDHAFRNEKWHFLQPISFDLVKPETIMAKASTWAGRGLALSDFSEMGKLHLLLGAPSIASNQDAYEKAKRLLAKVPIAHEIIEENEFSDFAKRFAEFVKEHRKRQVS